MAAIDPTLRTTLYVGDLHPDVTENDVAETFRRAGPLVSVHLCRDKLTLRSRCYAYVNFYYHSHAQFALNCLNHAMLRGKSMRVMWCQKDPISRKNGTGNLFVKNLDSSITSARLKELFSKYGTILSCKVAEYKGFSKGFGFVQFDSEDSARAALIALHETVLEGRKLYVSKFLKKIERKDTQQVFNNLYVKYIDKSITDDFLRAKFSEYGNVCNAVIVKDEKGKSKGFGFVKFDSHEAAKKAVEALNGQLIGSKYLFVARAQKKAERTELLRRIHGDKPKAPKLYVMNLDASVDDTQLEKHFSSHGKVTSAKVIRYSNGISKGFGFVQFSCAEEAKNARNSLNGADFQGRTLYVALAQNKKPQTGKLQKTYDNFPPQPICTYNPHPICTYNPQQICTYNPQPLYCNFAPNPTLYQSFGRPFGCFYPSLAHNFQNAFYGRPMQIASSDKCRQVNYVGIGKDQNPSGRLQNNSTSGDANEICKGSGTVKIVFPRYAGIVNNAVGNDQARYSEAAEFAKILDSLCQQISSSAEEGKHLDKVTVVHVVEPVSGPPYSDDFDYKKTLNHVIPSKSLI
ncbi:hypothetical protein BUALT_Bualt07G0152400 [Buddleja alternifolia]|uniref:RRM domain-containing protein n=1 Tax=Buddleja alternifolia TaxID=168488 RepID=A0AAV6XJ58_9LAMI|nr:hypothetical protein BUALT_Bualt07G0152400 [Buddleja alternifolia]